MTYRLYLSNFGVLFPGTSHDFIWLCYPCIKLSLGIPCLSNQTSGFLFCLCNEWPLHHVSYTSFFFSTISWHLSCSLFLVIACWDCSSFSKAFVHTSQFTCSAFLSPIILMANAFYCLKKKHNMLINSFFCLKVVFSQFAKGKIWFYYNCFSCQSQISVEEIKQDFFLFPLLSFWSLC